MHAVAAARFNNRTYRTMVRNVELMTYWITMSFKAQTDRVEEAAAGRNLKTDKLLTP